MAGLPKSRGQRCDIPVPLSLFVFIFYCVEFFQGFVLSVQVLAEKKADTLRQALAEAEDKVKEKVKAMAKAAAAHKRELAKSKKREAGLTKSLEATKAKVSDLAVKRNTLSSTQAELKRREAELASCRNDLESCREELTSCRDELAECRTELKATKAQNGQGLASGLRQELASARAQVDTLLQVLARDRAPVAAPAPANNDAMISMAQLSSLAQLKLLKE